jgi:hypothetical protein
VPRTALDWFLLLVVAPIVCLAAEWGADRLFSREMGERISPKRFSFRRIAFGVLVAVSVLAPVFAWWARR